jgi:hypothetical protein
MEISSRCRQYSVRRKPDAADREHMPLQYFGLPCLGIPYPDSAVIPSRKKCFPIRRKINIPNYTLMIPEHLDLFSCGNIPDAYCFVT